MGLGFPQILLTSHWLERRVRLVTAICMLSTDAWRRERAYCPLVVLEVLASHSVTSDTTLAGAWTILAVADCHNITSSHIFLHFKLFWPIHKVDRRVMYVCAQLLQLCLTLCDPVDCSLRDSSAHGILQARILERVAIAFSRGSSQLRDWTCVSYTAGAVFTAEPLGVHREEYNELHIPTTQIQQFYFASLVLSISLRLSYSCLHIL